MTENIYFIQLASDHKRFEEVPEKVFAERQKAMRDYVSDLPRYTNNWFGKVNGELVINMACSPDVAATVMRMLGVTMATGTMQNGWASKPDVVPIQRGKRRFVVVCQNDGPELPMRKAA